MNVSLSPQTRVVALLGLAALAALVAVTMFTLKHRHTSKTSAPAPVVRQGGAPGSVPQPHTTVRPNAAGTHAGSKPAVHRPARLPRSVVVALSHGWPKQVAKAFAHNRVVVVEVYSSDAPLDRDALAEAAAGATQVGAGLVAVDVSKRKDTVAKAVIDKLGLMDSPTTVVLRRPGSVFVQLGGFQDQGSVAQAAANAGLPS